MRIFRQGDVVLREVRELPESRCPATEGSELRITGETGNDHVLTDVLVVETSRGRYVQVPEEGRAMTHPQHPPLVLPPLLVARVERVRTMHGAATD